MTLLAVSASISRQSSYPPGNATQCAPEQNRSGLKSSYLAGLSDTSDIRPDLVRVLGQVHVSSIRYLLARGLLCLVAIMAQATFWHPRFYELLRMQGPRWLRIHTESPLSEIASVVDMVFEKPDVKSSDPVNSLYGNDCIFADLWPRLGRLTIVEFKSVSRPCRALDLRRLLRCTMAYGDQHRREIATRDQLTAVLFVPRINRSLREEIAYIGGSLHELDAGYAKILGPILYTTYIVSLDDVAESEDNDFLRIFTSRCQVRDLRARRWMANWFQGGSAMQERELEGYDDAVSTFLASLEPEQRLAGLAAEERLAGLAAEERLAGLTVREVMQSMQLSAQDLLEVLPENERRDLRALLAQEERQG